MQASEFPATPAHPKVLSSESIQSAFDRRNSSHFSSDDRSDSTRSANTSRSSSPARSLSASSVASSSTDRLAQLVALPRISFHLKTYATTDANSDDSKAMLLSIHRLDVDGELEPLYERSIAVGDVFLERFSGDFCFHLQWIEDASGAACLGLSFIEAHADLNLVLD
jgi:hypothetical protein